MPACNPARAAGNSRAADGIPVWDMQIVPTGTFGPSPGGPVVPIERASRCGKVQVVLLVWSGRTRLS
jgi:hypothetical protein